MQVIYKYSAPVEPAMDVEMPAGAEVIHVGDQTGRGDTIQFWALVPLNKRLQEKTETRRFRLCPTGTAAPDDAPHIGTVISGGGRLVWHIFDGGAT
jgi:hypothetical protein